MKLPPLAYARPETEAELCALLAEHGPRARLLAGGQSLIPLLALRQAAPEMLVDLGRISALRHVARDSDTLVLGAMLRHADIERDATIARHAPMLAEAAGHLGNPEIRARGTLGGSLAHADPGAEWPAAALCLDAILDLRGPRGARQVSAAEWRALEAPDEYLAAVRVPVAAPGEVQVFEEIAPRPTAPALAGLALRWRPGAARLVAFAVGARPLLLQDTGAALAAGQDGDALAATLAAEAAPRMTGDVPYKLHLLRTLLARTVRRLPDEVTR